MSAIPDQLCLDAAELASSVYLRTIYFIKILFSIVGSLCVFHLHKTKSAAWIPNPNAKLLYRAHIYFTFHVCFFFGLVYIYQIVRPGSNENDPCSFVMNGRLSCLIKLMPVFAIHSQSFNMFTFAIERALSTFFHKRYERLSKPYLGIFLLALSIMAALALEIFCDILPTSPDLLVSGITLRNSDNSSMYEFGTYFPLGIELLTITIFGLTYFLNLRKAKTMERNPTRLGDKYQIAENIKVIRTLFPCFAVHFFLNCSSYSGLWANTWLHPHFEMISSAAWVEFFSQSQMYTIALPWIVWWQMKNFRKLRIVDNSETAANRHFQQLDQLFHRKK